MSTYLCRRTGVVAFFWGGYFEEGGSFNSDTYNSDSELRLRLILRVMEWIYPIEWISYISYR